VGTTDSRTVCAVRDRLPELLGLAAAVVIAIAAALARRRRQPRRTAPPVAAPPVTGPQPGEIWWADVPYEDGTGSKVRPCLVLRAHRSGVDVLKITSQDKSRRSDHVRIPTRSWDRSADRDSYLDLTDPIRVAPRAFADHAGKCDPVLWRKVQKLHGLRRA
jgi:hypothetical protein